MCAACIAITEHATSAPIDCCAALCVIRHAAAEHQMRGMAVHCSSIKACGMCMCSEQHTSRELLQHTRRKQPHQECLAIYSECRALTVASRIWPTCTRDPNAVESKSAAGDASEEPHAAHTLAAYLVHVSRLPSQVRCTLSDKAISDRRLCKLQATGTLCRSAGGSCSKRYVGQYSCVPRAAKNASSSARGSAQVDNTHRSYTDGHDHTFTQHTCASTPDVHHTQDSCALAPEQQAQQASLSTPNLRQSMHNHHTCDTGPTITQCQATTVPPAVHLLLRCAHAALHAAALHTARHSQHSPACSRNSHWRTAAGIASNCFGNFRRLAQHKQPRTRCVASMQGQDRQQRHCCPQFTRGHRHKRARVSFQQGSTGTGCTQCSTRNTKWSGCHKGITSSLHPTHTIKLPVLQRQHARCACASPSSVMLQT